MRDGDLAAVENALWFAREYLKAMEKGAITNTSQAKGYDVTGYLMELAESAKGSAERAIKRANES